MNKKQTEKLAELKLKLGSNLVDKIDNTREKYGGRGFKIGLSGGLIGGGLGYILTKDAKWTAFSTFIGTALGINLGYAFGLKYGEHRINTLEKEFPEVKEDIKEYLQLKMLETYENIRPAIKSFEAQN
jgi:F0F1-type ATP synthase assembly protein I